MTTIPQLLFDQAARRPSALAIEDGDWQLSYGELAAQVKEAVGVMRHMGLSHGDTFGIWAPNCAEWIIAALAGQSLGAVMVTLNTRYKGVEAADILRRARCKLLFTVKGFLGHDYPAMLEGQDLPTLQDIVVIREEAGRGAFEAFLSRKATASNMTELSDKDISDIIFTSGTTGAPKGAMTTHAQNVQVFESFTDAIGMTENDRYLVVNPFFHSFGYKAGWLSCLIKGAAIFPLAVYHPKDVLERIERDKITVMPGAPTIFQTLLAHPDLSKHDISSLRVATTGATTIPVDLIRAMHEDLGIDDVFSAYGLTESTGVVSLCQKGDDFETIATTCGRPLPGTELRLVGDNGQDIGAGEEGEIWVKGFNVMQGYLDMPEATADTITPDGWLKTGDIGTQNAEGYIKITDRKKDMVIVGGFNVYPAEVEKALLQHPAIADAAVTGVPDERLGEVTHAHIVLSEKLSKEDLTTWCRETMANYKVPREISLHDQLPRNASGKVS
ncbi:FadD3 family acyl-CoA ligase [Hellea sp.]|nr:FadD3 family acyl-CoA ligase [Hellea sp.]